MIDSLFAFAAISLLASPLCAFPTGAPISTCKSLEPQHTAAMQCGRNCPFKLTLVEIDNKTVSNAAAAYACGAMHKLRLQATNGNLIKGFSVQARQATTEFDNRAPHIGRFVGGGFDWKLWPCDPGSPSATHRSNSDKKFIDLTWRAPDTPSSQGVVFWYTVVVDFAEYYVRLRGPQLNPACSEVLTGQGLRLPPTPTASRRLSLRCESRVDQGVWVTVNCSFNSHLTAAQCKMDGEAEMPCRIPYRRNISQLTPGTHRIRVTAMTAGGSSASASTSFRIHH